MVCSLPTFVFVSEYDLSDLTVRAYLRGTFNLPSKLKARHQERHEVGRQPSGDSSRIAPVKLMHPGLCTFGWRLSFVNLGMVLNSWRFFLLAMVCRANFRGAFGISIYLLCRESNAKRNQRVSFKGKPI